MKLYAVIPCYNEEDVLRETARVLREKFESLISQKLITEDSKILFVNDGSKDKTWEIVETLHSENPIFSGVKLSRNKGHQNALLAGLMTVKDICDVSISLDADLQDDINAIDEMVKKAHDGCEIVYGVRSKRVTDTFFKRLTAEGFYKIMGAMGVELTFNHADYRLISSRVLKELEKYKEVNLFLRGIIPLLGFKSDIVYYERAERFAGESKYPLKKMLALAWEGVTSFSIKPIRLITSLGMAIFVLSIIALVLCFTTNYDRGWSSIVASIWAVGGLQMFAFGIIGEYIGKIYLETKARPNFIVETFLDR